MSVFSGHTDYVNSVSFSLDETFLVSGSDDKTVKLWDVQTGGVIRTLQGHTDWVRSISVSPDQNVVASGSRDKTIRLWNAQTGNCYCLIDGFSDTVNSISFSPSDSQHLVSVSEDHFIKQWGINGHQIGPTYQGSGATFSKDGTFLAIWRENVALVQDPDSGAVITKLQVPESNFDCCCFSPDGRFFAGSAGLIIFLWNITGSEPHLIETCTGHSDYLISLAFSSSLISSSNDKSIKIWQITTLTESEILPMTSAPVTSVSLQAKDGIALSSDSAGVVTVWDILTGSVSAGPLRR